MNPLEAYLSELRDIRATGAAVQGASYCSALANRLLGPALDAGYAAVKAEAWRGRQ